MSTPSPLSVSRAAARRFHRGAVGLDTPHPTLAAALQHHGYVQIDPINVCGRMHDLILRNRVANYREGDLMRHLHGDAAHRPAESRTAFEHHLPDTGVLVAFPLEAWPHLLAAMRARTRRPGAWSGRLTPRERELAPAILAEIAQRGPLSSADIDDDRRAHRSVWGSASLAKSTLQKLFFHGRVLIARREGSRRYYDLPERTLPAATLAQPEPDAAATARWLALLKLRQRRLALLKREELRLVADAVQPVAVADIPPLYCLRADAEELARCEPDRAAPAPDPTPRLLAPLDPLIYDRRVTQALWDFNYTWEVYTPPARRIRGYYALPILAGTEIVGHIDPKADRATGCLQIANRRVASGHAITGSVDELAQFLGLRRAGRRGSRSARPAPTRQSRA